ncbi:MAG: Spx/MgsR family RNA polymerase-binding regulatory protein [Candidatus Cyclonatronum sp.]|uniref:arsenate reductase family protein n=1 Tax=Cyclonatronum sp. TaxID=3024185 RepID=UPI0025C058AC|nr:Spx/MgsR family RNA polymerase-binding regulatory protein [Cyclonatronum sp.]MCC5932926.1 Spx/MgsR family RNA polymerase-binding regulatory protein [Balneolales bacterium]MCH8486595.1 Spx/MgsR family RNA polymerase-binding regulatory protein [Cyclonatronum sp.]
MLTVVGIKNCNTISKTLKWLEEQEINYTFRDVKKNPLSAEELEDAISKVGLDTLVNRRGMKWRSLGLAGKELTGEELAEILFEHQTMIKRPLLLAGDAAMVGFDEDALGVFAEEYA